MEIDNFGEIRKHLTFKSDFDRYIVHVLKRAKDDNVRMYGTNETNRLLKTFYITSLDYFDRKIPVIKDLCVSNSARAYILPQVRNNEECLKNLLKLVVDNLSNPTQKPDHLIRSAYCGFHGSRDKKWILDLDSDNMVEYHYQSNFGGFSNSSTTWTPDEVLKFVQSQLTDIGKSKEDAWIVPTKNGHCIVTSPFNLQKAHEKCNMLFQGTADRVVGKEHSANKYGVGYLPVSKSINGWLIKDGMVLLYMNLHDTI